MKKQTSRYGVHVETIPEYIKAQPKELQGRLRAMRALVRAAAPKAEEAISYGMPTYKQEGNLVHFAGWKTHIGFYPGPVAIKAFAKELSKYELTKGTIQLPLNAPLPEKLIKRIVAYRIKANLEKKKK